jgi:hypothetical protein
MVVFEEIVVATTVAVAAVTKANTKAVRMKSFRMVIPHLLSPSMMPISSAIACDRHHKITD